MPFLCHSHGKGAVDGVKRLVERRVLRSRTCIVNDAESFAECCKGIKCNIQVIYISVYDTDKNRQLLEERWQDVKPVPWTKLGLCSAFC